MPFLRINAQGMEWGFEVPDGFIPAVGDRVTLWYAKPDEVDGAEDGIEGVVTKRHWGFAEDFMKEQCVDLEVDLFYDIPDGYIAHSTEWPASEWSKRRAEIEAWLARIKAGG